MIFFKKWVCDDGITIRNILRNVQPTIKTGRDALIKALQEDLFKKQRTWMGVYHIVEKTPF
jgi:hypothetical protein